MVKKKEFKELVKKFQTLQKEMESKILERREEIEGLLIALLSRQHMLLISVKGTAKSLMVRMLSEAVVGSKKFERLFTKFTTPDEVFGPVKLSALKEDKYERHIEGHLPDAHFAFIDEIFKANSSILNSLLTIINERIYHNNSVPMKVPLETMVGCSNELPEGEELDALYDRFLLRYMPQYIQEESNFIRMLKLTDEDLKINTKITFDELHKAQEIVSKIEVPDSILEKINDIREKLKAEGIQPSDRRYREALKCIKAHAFLKGKDVVTTDDLSVLQHILWDEPEHITTVKKIVLYNINPYMQDAEEIYDGIRSVWDELDKMDRNDSAFTMKASEANAKIRQAVEQLVDIRKKLEKEGYDTSKIDEYIEDGKRIITEKIAKEIFKIDIEL